MFDFGWTEGVPIRFPPPVRRSTRLSFPWSSPRARRTSRLAARIAAVFCPDPHLAATAFQPAQAVVPPRACESKQGPIQCRTRLGDAQAPPGRDARTPVRSRYPTPRRLPNPEFRNSGAAPPRVRDAGTDPLPAETRRSALGYTGSYPWSRFRRAKRECRGDRLT